MGTLRSLLLEQGGTGDSASSAPQWEGSELGPAVALHENEAPEPQPLSCTSLLGAWFYSEHQSPLTPALIMGVRGPTQG